jgi:hypothetical protein
MTNQPKPKKEETSTRKSEGAGPEEGAAAAPRGPELPLGERGDVSGAERLEAIQRDYFNQLRNAWEAARQQCQGAYQGYMKALSETTTSGPYSDTHANVGKAYRGFVAASQRAMMSRDDQAKQEYQQEQERLATAYQDLSAARQEAQKRQVSAYQAYMQAMSDAAKAAQQSYWDAFRAYVRAQQKHMASLDVDNVQPHELMALGQTLMAIGYHASWSLGGARPGRTYRA